MTRFSRRDALSLAAKAGALAAAGPVVAAFDAALGSSALAQTAKRGGKLVYAQCSANRRGGDASNSKHPYYMVDLITRSAYSALTWVNEDLKVVNELAKRLEPTDSSLAVWEAEIVEGVLFHDGRPVTSADVAASFELHRRNNFASRQITKVEAVGPLTVRFHLDAGNSEFPFVLAEYDNVVMPAAPIETIGLSGIGTGPFRIVSVDPQRRMVLERNEAYWRKDLPLLDQLEVVNREGQMEAALNGFRARQFDAVLNIDPRLTRQLEKEADTEIVPASSGDQAVIILPKHPGSPFLDQRVRKAMALALDREAIVRVVYGGPKFGWAGNDSHLAGNDPNFTPLPVKRDLAKAKALLAEAGYPNGITLPTMYFAPQWPEMPRVFQVMQEQLREAGVQMPIEERPTDGYQNFRTGDPDVAKGNWHKFAYTAVGPRNPGISLFRMRNANNESGYWSGPGEARYMELYRKAMVTGDAASRKALYAEMQAITAEEVPALLPAGRNNLLVKRPAVKNLRNHAQHWSIRWDDVSIG